MHNFHLNDIILLMHKQIIIHPFHLALKQERAWKPFPLDSRHSSMRTHISLLQYSDISR